MAAQYHPLGVLSRAREGDDVRPLPQYCNGVTNALARCVKVHVMNEALAAGVVRHPKASVLLVEAREVFYGRMRAALVLSHTAAPSCWFGFPPLGNSLTKEGCSDNSAHAELYDYPQGCERFVTASQKEKPAVARRFA